MAKLYFRYGAMGCGKTMQLLQVAFNYEERGHQVCVMKPKTDTKNGEKLLTRIGPERVTDFCFEKGDDLFEILKKFVKKKKISCVLVDEAQFLTRANVYDLARIVDELDIPVMAFGLKNDFQNNLFEGSKYLLLLSDKIDEIKTICHYCSRKATMVLRMEDGKPVYEGAQVQIGGHESYISVCRKHWFNPPQENIIPLNKA